MALTKVANTFFNIAIYGLKLSSNYFLKMGLFAQRMTCDSITLLFIKI